MELASFKLDDLPDEIIVFILRKLYGTEVLYSLMGVNQRLSTIAHDSLFTGRLTFAYWIDNRVYPPPAPILDRFCTEILHEIHHKIKWLDLESTSFQRILNATDYPNLYGLGVYRIDIKEAITLFTGQNSKELSCFLKVYPFCI